MHIPIQNIYFLLCYAWNKLEEQGKVRVEITDETTLPDLFAKVLIQGTRILLKRGIDKSYQAELFEIPGIKGKIEWSDTLKANILHKLKTRCTIDEYTSDILSNQLLVSTLHRLIQHRDLSPELKAQIKPLIWKLPPVQRVEIRSSLFRQVRIHRNNRLYGFLLNICEIIHQNSLPTEEAGKWTFADFRRDDRKMNQLFEAFLFNFYKRELSGWKVKREKINWQFESIHSLEKNYLPNMITDISIENATEKIIIDAKYYRETLSTHFQAEKIKSANLYQLFSYLLNQEDGSNKTAQARGILIYPTIEQDYDLIYQYGDHRIEIRTVNLAMDWQQIAQRLKAILSIE